MRSRQSDGSLLPRFAVCSRGGSPRRFISGGGDYVLTACRKVLSFWGRDNPGGAPLTERAGYVNAWRSGKNRLSDEILVLGRMATRTKENPATSAKRPGRGQRVSSGDWSCWQRQYIAAEHDVKGSSAMVLKDPPDTPVKGRSRVAVVSTTATISNLLEKPSFFDPVPEVLCDWLSGVHYLREPLEPRNSGRVMKITADGVIEWETQTWEVLHCASSDTSLRVKFDGVKLWFSGNIGRFQESDNRTGLTVAQCVEKWKRVLDGMGFPVEGFGSRYRVEPEVGAIVTAAWVDNDVAWRGTTLTRVDLAGNCQASDYPMLCQAMSVRKIGQHKPILGRYGPTWGYGKRSGWWKAKLYDKEAEQAGRRNTASAATVARFELQFGGEWLRRNGLETCESWTNRDGGVDMGQVVWGRFAEQAFRDGADGASFAEVPQALQLYAYAWKDGRDVRSMTGQANYYRVRKELLKYGMDVGVPCNVVALKREVQQVRIEWLPALRREG